MVSKIDISLSAELRESFGRKVKDLRAQDLLPAVVYGQKTENLALVLNFKEFEDVFKKTGESSLINLKIKDKEEELPVLIHSFQKDPLSGKIIHVDFYKPDLEKKVKAIVPLKIEGSSPAIKNLGGTLIKNLTEVEVKALPTNIPHEIIVNVDSLETAGSEIFVKDLNIPEGVEVLKDPEEVVVLVAAAVRVEEELEKAIEENIENIEGVVKEGEEGETEDGDDKEKKEEESQQEQEEKKK